MAHNQQRLSGRINIGSQHRKVNLIDKVSQFAQANIKLVVAQRHSINIHPVEYIDINPLFKQFKVSTAFKGIAAM